MKYAHLALLILSAIVISRNALAEDTINKAQFEQAMLDTQQLHVDRLQELLAWCLEKNAKTQAVLVATELVRLAPACNANEQLENHKFTDKEPAYPVRAEFLSKWNAAQKAAADDYYVLGSKAQNSFLVEETKKACDAAIAAWPDHHDTREHLLSQSWVKGYGWLAQEDAQRYAKGLRPLNGDWKPLKTVERERKRWNNAWEFQSSHWKLKTNTDEETGLHVLDLLEAACSVFKDEFGEALDIRPTGKHMQVNLFSTHDEFVKNIKIANPKLNPENINGQYDYQTRESYFFYFVNDDPKVLTNTFEQTCLHEAFHQLCHATMEIDLWYATRPHFWVTEGMADYFGGTFDMQNNQGSLGSPDRFKSHVSYVKMSQGGTIYDLKNFFAMTQKEYHGNNGSAKYSQGYCLAYFMLHGDNGALADKTRRYLKEVLCGKGSDTLFEDIFGAEALKSLEKDFKLFVRD